MQITNKIPTYKKIMNLIDFPSGIFDKSILEFKKFRVRKNLKKYQKKKSDFEFVLVVGCPRSGTTLLESILSTHKNVSCPLGEVDFSDKNFSDLFKRIFGNEGKTLEKIFKEYTKGKYLLIKRPTAVFYLDELKKYFPKMKVINIIRDGRDVVPSTIDPEKPIQFPSYSFGVRQWKKAILYFRKFKGNKINVKYEELINNPKEEINRVLKFLDLEKMSKKEILEFYEKIDEKKNIPGRSVGTPLAKDSLGKGKESITKKQKRIFKKYARKVLVEEGYEKWFDW